MQHCDSLLQCPPKQIPGATCQQGLEEGCGNQTGGCQKAEIAQLAHPPNFNSTLMLKIIVVSSLAEIILLQVELQIWSICVPVALEEIRKGRHEGHDGSHCQTGVKRSRPICNPTCLKQHFIMVYSLKFAVGRRSAYQPANQVIMCYISTWVIHRKNK